MDYRSTLSEQYKRRKAINPAYSKRAFARDLGISPSTLVNVISGRFNLSSEKGEEILDRLNLSKEEELYFRSSVAKDSRSKSTRALAANKWVEIKNDKKLMIDAKTKKVLSSVYHLATLELIELYKSGASVSDVANQFSIDLSLAGDILSDLQMASLVFKKVDLWFSGSKKLYTGNDIASHGVRVFHLNSLELAAKKLRLGVDEREYQSMVFKLSSKNFTKFKEMIRNFFDEVEEKASTSPDEPDCVFMMSTQMFLLNSKKGPVYD